MLQRASEVLRRAERVVVFTGAGMSAEAGVPTFRDAQVGLWERYDPAELATSRAFRDDPALVWGWYEWRRSLVLRTQPHTGHRAVAAIESRAPHVTLVTQNVDDLHERAGSSAPIRLHGSLFAPRCSACERPAALPDLADDLPEGGQRLDPPRCGHCGAPVRPGVVWFGESLPEDALGAAIEAAATCDVLLTVGTSGVVYPAAEIPRLAARRGAAVIQVNPEHTALDIVASVSVPGTAAEILPRLIAAAWGTDRS